MDAQINEGWTPCAHNSYVLEQSRKFRRDTKTREPEDAGASAIYFWDSDQNQFITPHNLTVDPNVKPGAYVLQASVFGFHASADDMSNLFQDNAHNVQINFHAEASQNGELITWMVKAGLSTAEKWLGGSDSQSVTIGGSPNQLTNIPAPQDQIVISDGVVSVTLALQAQKKDGWWETFLKAIGLVTNSPMFAVVPMAKLIGETVDAITQMTTKIEQDENLELILEGNKLECNIYKTGVSTKPYVLKPGYWLMAKYSQLAQYVDWNDNENLKKGIYLDFNDQQYDVLDANNGHQPIDVTYAVIELSLSPKAS
jgi:hypothetical protein